MILKTKVKRDFVRLSVPLKIEFGRTVAGLLANWEFGQETRTGQLAPLSQAIIRSGPFITSMKVKIKNTSISGAMPVLHAFTIAPGVTIAAGEEHTFTIAELGGDAPSLIFKNTDLAEIVMYEVTMVAIPDVPLTKIMTDAQTLETHYDASRSGSHAEIAAMDAAEIVLDNDLLDEAKYVERITNGNETAILATGYHHTKTESSPTPKPDKPQNFHSKPVQQAGSIHLLCNKLDHAASFVYLIGTNLSGVTVRGNLIVTGAVPVTILADKHRSVIISGLAPATVYQCRMFGISSAGKGLDSDTINVTAP